MEYVILVTLATPFIVFTTVLGVVCLQQTFPHPPCAACGYTPDDEEEETADEGTSR